MNIQSRSISTCQNFDRLKEQPNISEMFKKECDTKILETLHANTKNFNPAIISIQQSINFASSEVTWMQCDNHRNPGRC